MNTDIRNLQKWLNEEQEAPIDRQALARVLAMAEQPAQQQERCHLCDCTGDIHSPDGEWHGECPHCKPAQQEPCDMGSLCIGCNPRNIDGSCPGQKPNGACDCYVNGFNDGMKEMEQPAQQEPNLPSQIGRLIEAANHAASKGLVSGTTNWAATVARYMMANAMQPEQRKPLTPTEVHGMAEAHGIDGDARHWYVVGLVDAQAKHNIKENT